MDCSWYCMNCWIAILSWYYNYYTMFIEDHVIILIDIVLPICEPWCWNIYLQNWLINMGFWCWYIFQHHGSQMGSTISITLKQCWIIASISASMNHRRDSEERKGRSGPKILQDNGMRTRVGSIGPVEIVALPSYNMVIFHSFLYVYQRVTVRPWTWNPCWVETHLITPSKIWMSGSNC